MSAVACSFLSSISMTYADFWQGGDTLQPGKFQVGGFGQYLFKPVDTVGYAQSAYGLIEHLQIEARIGIGTIDTFWGLFAKYGVIQQKNLELAFFGGYRHQANGYADLGLIMSRTQSLFQVYVGTLVQFPLQNGLPIPLNLTPGLNYQFADAFRLYGELNINMGNSNTAFSSGVKYFF